ncbi:glycerol-3-phosphate dehydrogenase [Hyphococcus sp.]|uniref:glycerol-3-phosphate dehydrogenase n=1 Tax=Hyphococcus sp. TaxID=2038636 RepID=UPI0035C697AC
MLHPPEANIYDVFVIGGGVNGCAAARDAAGRGLSVCLAEMGDLASATSSASTKLFHGGLRYLEYCEFRLVREALLERETLLRAMPHISWPLRFVLPFHKDMRFDSKTPVSRLLGAAAPWLSDRRPAWLIRFGLILYDALGKRRELPASASLDLANDPAAEPLKPHFRRAFEYSDCWIDDSRLVALTARDAAERGASVLTHTKVISANRRSDHWAVKLKDMQTGAVRSLCARSLINAAGPWVGRVGKEYLQLDVQSEVRLVRGSHIVTKRLFSHDKAYFLQGADGRIVFAIPYETDFTLIGTTEIDYRGDPADATCTQEERDYLCEFLSGYFKKPLCPEDILWTFSGVRPLLCDKSSSATAATRDYDLALDEHGAPCLNILGGKITTHRRCAERAIDKLSKFFPACGSPWTAAAALPGGGFTVSEKARVISSLLEVYPFLEHFHAERLVKAYGDEAPLLLGKASSISDLGRYFGATLTEKEVIWMMEKEFARTAGDIVWRRSKLGLRMNAGQIAELDAWMAKQSLNSIRNTAA